MPRPGPAATLALAVVVTACASPAPSGPPDAAVPLETAHLPPEVSDLWLTVYPTPRQAAYGSVLLPLEGAERIDQSSRGFLDALERQELLATWRDLPHEGYVLQVGWDAARGRTLLLVAGRDEAGARWAEHALSQLSTTGADGRRLVRDALVIDAPGFPLRGSKRPQVWEEAYRANFAWGARDEDAYARREVLPFFAPGSPFDATADGLRAALETFGPWQRRGVRRFAVKFDDVGFGLTSRAQLAFGSYPRAVSEYLRLALRALRSVDAEARLYYLPQTYWWDDARLPAFAAALRGAGGLPSDVGLVLTGPEIVSASIDAAGLAAAQRAFGVGGTRALVYDNLGREGDWGPLTGRDPRLVEVADGVFGERGTPVNRLTRLDWSWNPAGYEAERSWRRALLELAGRDGYVALRDACRAFRAGAPHEETAQRIARFADGPGGEHAGPLPRDELVRLLRADLARLGTPGPRP